MIDKRNTRNEKNAQTQRDRNTTVDMDEVRTDGDDDDEVGYSEDDHGEDEDGAYLWMRMQPICRQIGCILITASLSPKIPPSNRTRRLSRHRANHIDSMY